MKNYKSLGIYYSIYLLASFILYSLGAFEPYTNKKLLIFLISKSLIFIGFLILPVTHKDFELISPREYRFKKLFLNLAYFTLALSAINGTSYLIQEKVFFKDLMYFSAMAILMSFLFSSYRRIK